MHGAAIPSFDGDRRAVSSWVPELNEKASGLEIASQQEGTALEEDHPDLSFLDTGRIRISPPGATPTA